MKKEIRRILNLEKQYKRLIAKKHSIENEKDKIVIHWNKNDWTEYWEGRGKVKK